jgi:Uma2 family endonuclease
MSLHEIVLPETKPETEWVRGRALRKMNPLRDHGRLQLALGTVLHLWAKGRGQVATEWRFRIAPPGEMPRPLVPDIAFVRDERLRGLTYEEAQAPSFAPDVAIEILSPGNRRLDMDDKINVFLRSGTSLVMLVHPLQRIVELHDAAEKRVLTQTETLEHAALPEFRYPLSELFAELDLPR